MQNNRLLLCGLFIIAFSVSISSRQTTNNLSSSRCTRLDTETGRPEEQQSKTGKPETVTIFPETYEKAFSNPFKGFRLNSLGGKNEYASLARLYVSWNQIENSAEDGVEKIIEYTNRVWAGVEQRNLKVIPRVYLEWPNIQQGTSRQYWPEDMTPGDYESKQFKERVVKLVEKMGEAWDNDPRIAFIEVGLIGWWGENHQPRVTPEMEKLLGDAFTRSFNTVIVMNRYPTDFRQYDFGIYWDSWIHYQERDSHVPLLIDRNWPSTPGGGEMAFDWGQKVGENPTDAVLNHGDEIVEFVRLLHWNNIGWVADYDAGVPGVAENALVIQKALGYRFVIDEVTYDLNPDPSGNFTMSFTVRNTGSSPLYYNRPVEVSWLDPETRQPVWKDLFSDVDVRQWLPGDQWNTEEGEYAIAPTPYTVSQTFTLPDSLADGVYILALSILDPAGNVPGVRFAIKNYYEGGRHPIGRTGKGAMISDTHLDPGDFFDLHQDKSLFYILE
jgi:hypothetical protein